MDQDRTRYDDIGMSELPKRGSSGLETQAERSVSGDFGQRMSASCAADLRQKIEPCDHLASNYFEIFCKIS